MYRGYLCNWRGRAGECGVHGVMVARVRWDAIFCLLSSGNSVSGPPIAFSVGVCDLMTYHLRLWAHVRPCGMLRLTQPQLGFTWRCTFLSHLAGLTLGSDPRPLLQSHVVTAIASGLSSNLATFLSRLPRNCVFTT